MAVSLYSSGSTDALLAAKLSDAPIDGSTYGRLDGAWAVVAGGGGLTVNDLSNGATSTLNATVPTTGQALTYDGTDLVWATVGGGAGTVTYSSPYLYDTVGAANITDINLGAGMLTAGEVGAGNCYLDSFGLSLTASSGAVITFADATTQSTAPHDLPIGGTTGQVLTKNSATNYDASWATASGGGGGVDIQTFGSSTTSGSFTWTKPANAKYVEIILWAGGGGGGAGARQATTVARGGGNGGAGGGFIIQRLAASELNSTETVTVGAGGTGGTSVTIDSTNGTHGTAGGDTNFKNWKALGGTRGLGGYTSNNSAAAAVSGYLYNQNQANGTGGAGLVTGIGQNGGGGSFIVTFSCGGAGGAGAPASGTANAAGANGGGRTVSTHGNMTALAGGSGGTTAGVSPTAGANSATYYGGGTGGGSGAYRTGVAGMNGAAGGWPAGGAGGGSSANNGFATGAGGAGANGFAVIITYT